MTAQPVERAPRMREVFHFGSYAWDITLAEGIVQGRDPGSMCPEGAGCCSSSTSTRPTPPPWT